MKRYVLALLSLSLAACSTATAPDNAIAANTVADADVTEVADETVPANAAENASAVDPD